VAQLLDPTVRITSARTSVSMASYASSMMLASIGWQAMEWKQAMLIGRSLIGSGSVPSDIGRIPGLMWVRLGVGHCVGVWQQ